MTDRAMIESFDKVTKPNFKFNVEPETIDDHWQTFQEAWAASQAHTRKEVIAALKQILSQEVMSKHVNSAECGAARNAISHCIAVIESLSQPTKG